MESPRSIPTGDHNWLNKLIRYVYPKKGFCITRIYKQNISKTFWLTGFFIHSFTDVNVKVTPDDLWNSLSTQFFDFTSWLENVSNNGKTLTYTAIFLSIIGTLFIGFWHISESGEGVWMFFQFLASKP